LEKLPHNIGIERTGCDPVRQTIHTLNLSRQSELQDTTTIPGSPQQPETARIRPLTGRLSLAAECANGRARDIREAAQITGMAGTGTRGPGYRPLPRTR
jgi:hypothetical protein